MNRLLVVALLLGMLAIGTVAVFVIGPPQSPQEPQEQRIGLMTSLPLYRTPGASVADALAAGNEEDAHWVRGALEENNALMPVDLLDPASLAQMDMLLLIQPRALTPSENVALDDWVRGGGRLLLVSDPMLTSEPRFALGDPRNPQAISVTGPIEARWGLSLQPGIAGDDREERIEIGGHSLPVVLGGRFETVPPAGGSPADCELRNRGFVAICAIGAGRAVLLADATLFERASPSRDAEAILWYLVGMTGDGPTG